MHILVVEDEPKLAQILLEYLAQENWQYHWIRHGDEVLPWLAQNQTDAILLDIMLPGTDGISLCREIRHQSQLPILMTTAKVDEIDRLLGLELGADDYICKPYSPREVIARLKAVFRRSDNRANETSAELILDKNSLQARLQKQYCQLTQIEFQLLAELAAHPGMIRTRNSLMDAIYNDYRIVSDRTIDSHIKKLRKKLTEAFPQFQLIHSVYGAGYRFEMKSGQ